MSQPNLPDLLIEKFGKNLYDKSLNFPNNKINIIFSREKPSIKIRAIILDNDREFHLIINQKKLEIFHDCPSFLIHSTVDEKICIHFLKLLLMIREDLALEILDNLGKFNLTSEDFGSIKKSKNYLLLANACFKENNCVEGLSYLNKAIINQSECPSIVENYLKTAMNNNLFVEFFEFLKFGYENELEQYFIKYDYYIEKGFKGFLNAVSNYSFFNILRIITALDKISEFNDFSFTKSLINRFRKMVNSPNFNEKYFSIYFIKRNLEKLNELDPGFNNIIIDDQLKDLKEDLLNYFFTEIDDFCLIDKLKLMKKQFEVIGIPKEKFYDKYKSYKNEIKELERKVYLKKFAFLKFLMEKHGIRKTNGEFRKKRNVYIINHEKENLKNPAYNYILSRIGFFGIDETIIKSSEIGVNFFIIKELFLDDLSSLPDVYYYRKQFWGENDDFKINPLDAFSLISENIHYNYDIDQKYSSINDVMIIEWDLANKPIQGSNVNAYGSQIIIPDPNNLRFDDLKPFDLCYCLRTPVKIEGNNIKTVNVLTKCSFKDAIKSVSKGMFFIEGFFPLSLVKAVLNKEISPFKANEIVINNPNKSFVPNYNQFVKNFREFLFNFIKEEKEYIFEEIKSEPLKKAHQILILLDLTNELAGLNLPYGEIIEKLLVEDIDLNEFKSKLLFEINVTIKNVLEKREIGSTIVFDLEKLKNTPFSKYFNEIVKIRKEEFENSKITKFEESFNFSEIRKTYYGQKFLKILNMEEKLIVKPEIYVKIKDYASKLNLKLNVSNEVES